jgi:hypothetical protein
MLFKEAFWIYAVALIVLMCKKKSRRVMFLGDGICMAIVITFLLWLTYRSLAS